MLPGENGKEKRCEGTSPRFDLRCGKGLKHPPYLSRSVLADQPAPMRKALIIDELYHDRLFILGGFKLLKSVRP
jgi:hypothetical protein